VLQLLDAVGGERQVLVGSSLGAWLALHAALRRPHLVKVGERLGWAAGQVALQLQAAAALAPACDLALRPDPCR
jgi:pimeloyl-ACP methyl ester carboxylesterase